MASRTELKSPKDFECISKVIKEGAYNLTVATDMTKARLRRKSLRIEKLTVVTSWMAAAPVGMMFY